MTRASDTARLISGGAVFNEASADVDFRVESDANTNALIVDGGHSTVGINTAAVSNRTLKIEGEGNLGAGVSLNESTRGGYVEYSAGSGTELYTGSELAITGGGNNNEFLIYTGVSALKIDRSGNSTFANNITLSDGDLTVASGHGISFAATSDASGQSSELLDDYEEGTWTPTYSGSNSNPTVSFTSQIARYTKVGRLVSVWGYLRVNSTSGGDGSLSIEGLPFTSANTNYVAGTVGYAHNWVSNATPTRLLVKTNSTTIRLYRQNTSDPRASMENVVVSSMANGCEIYFAAVYYE